MSTTAWQAIFTHVFGRKGLEYCTDIWPLIIAVDEGIKPALLWDISLANSAAIAQLLTLAFEKKLIKTQLKVVELEEDVMIVNVKMLLNSLVEVLQRKKSWIIDLTKGDPKIGTKEVHDDFQNYLIAVMNQLDLSSLICEEENNEASGSPSDTESPCVMSLNLPEGVNLSTMFGVFLGYPQVYWWQGDSGGESLTGTPLKVFKFTAHFTMEDTEVELFSYSIPECFEEQLRPEIELWGNKVNAMVARSAQFSQTKFNCNPVLCLSVAL